MLDKIYYNKLDGTVLKVSANLINVEHLALEEEYEDSMSLQVVELENVGVIDLPYGEFLKISEGSTSMRVNLDTLELEFGYEPIPQEPSQLDRMEEALKAVLRGDMQSLAFQLYPDDFKEIEASRPELLI